MDQRIISILIVGLLVFYGFIGIFIITSPVSAVGPTYVSGSLSSDTTWYLTDSPYIVMGDITVEPGFTLTIEPGVEVRFNGTHSIIVDGTLIASGTPASKITFTSNQSVPAKGDWYTIRLRTDNNLIENAEVEYATYGIFLSFFGCNNTISNTTVKYCKFDGIYITNSDNNTISNCTVTSNDKFGITIYESHRTNVINCTIQNNNFFGINLNASTHTQIYDTNISYNDGKGILLYSNSHNTTISGCQIDWNNHIGIDLWGTSDNDIINTTIIGNNGIGIDFHDSTKNQWIENCTIMDNEETGIDLRGSSYVDIVGCNVSRNKGKGGIYSAIPVSGINITKSEVWNNLLGNGIDFFGVNWVNITDSNILANVGNGIRFNSSSITSNNIIKNCTIAANSNNGVLFYAYYLNEDCYIQNNNIYLNRIYSNHQNSIYFYVASFQGGHVPYIQYNNIYSNTIYSNNNNGIIFHSYYCGRAHIKNNNIYSNTVYLNDQNGIYFYTEITNTIYLLNNNIYSNTIYLNGKNGIYFHGLETSSINYYYNQNNNIYSNIIYSNHQNGIYFYAFAGVNSYIENNTIYSNTIYQHIGGNSSVGNALDNLELSWRTGGYADWIVDNSTFYYDGDSINSGIILDNYQMKYIETTVVGPGVLTFYWKVFGYNNPIDGFEFYIDNTKIDSISGDVDWHQKIYNVSSGLHFIKWVYEKGITPMEISHGCWLDKVEFTGNSGASGILLLAKNPTPTWQESRIYNNTIISNSNGILLSNIKSHVIFINNISNNNEGILFMQSTTNSLRYNNITYNNFTGITLTSSSNSNTIENNNIASNNISGIIINEDSNDNQITHNNITHNTGVGLNITDASGNQIHHNNFINNTQNAYDNTIALNDWDDGSEGNYWSDYLGTDDDGDGFGEDPYIILGGGSRDWHPFIELVDISAPYIISTAPPHGSVNVPVDTTISITFSKEMNKTAVEGAISISGGLTPTGFVWDAGNETVTFTPSSNLDSGTKYTVTITTDAKDILGNRKVITYVFSFTTEDTEAPWIVSTSPFDGEIDVDLNANIVVIFNEPMQPSSVTHTCTPDPFGWSVSWNGANTEATFSHNNFGNKAIYTFHIATGKDVAGLDLVAGPVPNPWSFTSEDILGPEIISTSPVHDSQNVSISAAIVVSFNEEMDVGTVTYTCSPDPLGWSVIWTNNDKTATFSHNNFIERTLYSFHITGAKDISGNDLNPGAVPNPWSFTTTGDYIGPQITMTSPADSDTNVDLDWNVTVAFNESMDTFSVNLVCIPDPGGWSEVWSNGDTVVTYSHNPFENGTSYTCNINTARDVPGNDLVSGAVPNPWTFITIGDLVGPHITSTSPYNNEIDVNLDTDIVVVFSVAIDPLSLIHTCSPDPGGWSESWSNGNTVVTLSHNDLAIGTFYTIQITKAEDISGNDLVSGPIPNPWSFTTIGDVISPEIISTSPIDNEIDVDINTDIIVTFSEAMDITSVNYICIPDPGGWSESWSNGDTVVTFSHDPFEYGTIHDFYIIAGKDVLGNDLSSGPVPNPWSFTSIADTIAPQIESTSPADNELDVNLETIVAVTFTEAMDTSSLDFTCSPDPGGWAVSWSNGDTVVTFFHNPFGLETTYTFHITAGKDLSGNDLTTGVVPHSWSFTTISIDSLTVTPPEVSIAVNGTVVLIAQAYDSQNNPVSGITYTWSIDNNLGTIFSQNQEIAIFQASSNTGTCIVNVSAGGKSANAVITIKSKDLDGIETEESRPENMFWIPFLWLLIIIACIVILVAVLWKKGQEEDRNQLEKDATPEGKTGNNMVGKEESETEIPPPPPPEETIDESSDVTEVPTESAPEEPNTLPADSTSPPPLDS